MTGSDGQEAAMGRFLWFVLDTRYRPGVVLLLTPKRDKQKCACRDSFMFDVSSCITQEQRIVFLSNLFGTPQFVVIE